MKMFYIAVACQGGCYILACIMNWVVSPFFRASLAKQCHLRYKIGVESINAFYIEIYQKHRKGAENGFTLIAFAIECLESASTSPHKKSLGILILNSILGQNPDNQELISIINTSTNPLNILIKMVGSKNPQYTHMRLL